MPGRPTLLAAALLVLPGCLEAGRPPAREAVVRPARSPNPALAGALTVTGVFGGGQRGRLNPTEVERADVERALVGALEGAGLLAPATGTARYGVSADVLDVEQPFRTEQETVTTTIRYTLSDLATHQPLLVKVVESPYVARRDSAFRTGDRSRVAGEGSIRESVDTFLDELAAFQPAPAPEPAPAAE